MRELQGCLIQQLNNIIKDSDSFHCSVILRMLTLTSDWPSLVTDWVQKFQASGISVSKGRRDRLFLLSSLEAKNLSQKSSRTSPPNISLPEMCHSHPHVMGNQTLIYSSVCRWVFPSGGMWERGRCSDTTRGICQPWKKREWILWSEGVAFPTLVRPGSLKPTWRQKLFCTFLSPLWYPWRQSRAH